VKDQRRSLSWGNIGLMSLVHGAAIGGMAFYLFWHGLSWAAAIIGLVLSGITIFSISAGYHRLFSHRSYEAHPVLRLFFLIFGAGAFQNTVLEWAADHRRHHARTDTDEDPYNALAGFWYSHIGWVLLKGGPQAANRKAVIDLERDPLVLWQDRHYAAIGITAGLVFPTLLGLAFGDPLGGFVVGGALRLLVCYHATFSINSIAHRLGSRRYSDKTTARDNLFVALLSMGEGYHNYHHAFPSDYRNGQRALDYDPSKWILRSLAALGVVRNLRRASDQAVVRARLRTDERRVEGLRIHPLRRQQLRDLRVLVEQALERWQLLAGRHHGKLDLRQRRSELRQVRRNLRARLSLWRSLVRDAALSGT
jgi:stearoyl-CoA desaturase (Delta-9 desaturase)